MTRVTAVIVTRDHAAEVTRCLASLRASTLPPAEVIVLDHHSTDGTADQVRRAYPEAAMLEYLDNPGFGVGVNRGRRVAGGDFLLLINPDATVAPDAIERLAAALDSAPDLGAVAPKVLLAGDPTRIHSAGLWVNRVGYACDRGYLEPDRGQYDAPEEVLAASGCALMVRARAYDEVGGFDRRYFLYYEDLDLCWRLWLAGYRVRYEPSAVAHHGIAAADSTGVHRQYHDHRNRLRTLLKNCGAATLARLALPVACFELTSLLALLLHGRLRDLGWRLRAQLAVLAHLPSALAARRRIQRARRAKEAHLFQFLVPRYGNPPPPELTPPRTKAARPPS